MTEPTICAKCKHMTPSKLAPNDPNYSRCGAMAAKTKTSYVTGEPVSVASYDSMLFCSQVNNGKCEEYEAK